MDYELIKDLYGITTLTGLRYAEGTDFNRLPAGIYIVNGKKILKKQ